MPNLRRVASALTILLCTTGQVHAEAPPAAPATDTNVVGAEADVASEAPAVHWTVDGQYRLWTEGRGGFPLDVDGQRLPADSAGYQLAELGAVVGTGTWLDVHLGVRAFSGALFGSPPCLGGGDCDTGPGGSAFDRPPPVGTEGLDEMLVPRAAYAVIRAPFGVFRVGHQTSFWGLGMMANDGRDGVQASRLDVFNERQFGDLVERVLFATRPLHAFGQPAPGSLADRFVVGLGADLVYRDENANLLEGDVAGQGVLILALRPPERPAGAPPLPGPDWELGTYSVFRYQVDRDDDQMAVAAFDVFGRVSGALTAQRDPLRGSLAAEAAWLYGSTDRVATEEGPDQVTVNALGLAVEASLEIPAPRSVLGLRVGLASGDANADDDTVYRFTFDRDFKAGLILFDHVLAEVSARSYDQATDPARSAYPARGVELFPSDGAVTGALFVNPIVIFEPLDGVAVALGGVWARATAPLVDPYLSVARGGEPTNPFGLATEERSLGLELDAMARYRWSLTEWLSVEARAEYGLFLFGAAFADAAGSRPAPLHYASGRLGLYW